MLKRKTRTAPAQETARDGGNFGAGFFIGLVSGAVGLFLLGTKQGHEVLNSVREQMGKKIDEKADEVLEPETKQKLIAAAKTVRKTAKQTANDWQEKFPKFQRKDSSS